MYPILILESESGPSEAEKGGGLDENETFEKKILSTALSGRGGG